ncbi:unnamed protein product [Citrullus colocynthis]|uniref:WAT1-related protein n=1 Tax=Citrullus colocynthis TaxID=252529 RepID=A0ABP0YIP5_9ROSI
MELKKPPLIAAIIVQITYSGMSILAKAAFASGMTNFIFIFYRQAFGTLFLIPPTIIFRRKEVACLSVGEMFKIFMLALLGFALVLKTCPSPLVLKCGQTLASTFQTFVVAIAVETNLSQWKFVSLLLSLVHNFY